MNLAWPTLAEMDQAGARPFLAGKKAAVPAPEHRQEAGSLPIFCSACNGKGEEGEGDVLAAVLF